MLIGFVERGCVVLIAHIDRVCGHVTCIHILTLVGSCRTALARIDLALSTGWMRAASSHTSSDSGHASHPCRMILRAWVVVGVGGG